MVDLVEVERLVLLMGWGDMRSCENADRGRHDSTRCKSGSQARQNECEASVKPKS